MVAAAARGAVAKKEKDAVRDRAAERVAALRQRQQQREVQSENHQVSFFRYVPALLAAGLKEVLDLVLIGSLPGLGTLITVADSITVFILLTFTRLETAFHPKVLFRRLIVMGIVTLIEGLAVGVNFLPLEMVSVILLYFLEKRSQK